MLEIRKSEFVTSVADKNYPEKTLPEFAFIGRSNCGKSTLINMLCNRKNLVKTGQTPGMTKLLNYFIINDLFYIVDMPGYGFAKVPISVKKSFQKLIQSYFRKRQSILKAVFLLMDSRRDIGDDEFFYLNLLAELKIPCALTITKTDKLSKTELIKKIRAITQKTGLDEAYIFKTSSLKKSGKEEILSVIDSYL